MNILSRSIIKAHMDNKYQPFKKHKLKLLQTHGMTRGKKSDRMLVPCLMKTGQLGTLSPSHCHLSAWSKIPSSMAPSSVSTAKFKRSLGLWAVRVVEGAFACPLIVWLSAVFVKMMQRNRTKQIYGTKITYHLCGLRRPTICAQRNWLCPSSLSPKTWVPRKQNLEFPGCLCMPSCFGLSTGCVMMHAHPGEDLHSSVHQWKCSLEKPSQAHSATNWVRHLAALWLSQADTEWTVCCLPGQKLLSHLCSFTA